VCLGRTARPETICPVNPAVGREATFAAAPAGHPVRLAIRGASVSALTAAWVAARRGHTVTVHEPGPVLGGLQGLRARVPGQEEIAETIEALARRAMEAGVTLVRDEPRPGGHDVLWAVGRPAPGRGDGGTSAARTVTSYDVLAAPGDFAGAGRALVVGDDLASTEAALLLADAGVRVELRSPARDIAVDAHPGFRDVARRGLGQRGAAIVTGVSAESAGASAAEPALAVAGAGARFDDDLGDAYEPGRLTETVYEAVARAAALDGPARSTPER
jgi:pyruvate/2-oxoglutarate dehydrogenase complex dihydrolipoamide dehydrogenase (E3) component